MIINKRELAKFHSDRSSHLVLRSLEAAIESVMPDALVESAVRFNNGLLVRDIYGKNVRLQNFDGVYIVGAGKAAAGMTVALQSILQERVSGGAINIPYGPHSKIKGISVTQASHPLPDKSGIEGTKKILNVLRKVRSNDIVFVLISGGGSALMPLPAIGVSLADKRKITKLLLRSGASIHEINTVRKHLSGVKGGQLLRHINSNCTVVSLIISDVVGDRLDAIASGPTCADRSTFVDAMKILKRYRITSPDRAISHIVSGAKNMIEETLKPGDPIFSRVHNMIIGNNDIASARAVSYLKKHGIHAMRLGSQNDGEARDFGAFLAGRTMDFGRRSFAIIAGGETTVSLDRLTSGKGGRNQEVAIAYMMELQRLDVALGCIGTDGIDGNSEAAGALISPRTIALAKKLDLKKYLDRHDSYRTLKKLHSLIFTGYTGTNVNDIAIVCGIPSQNAKKKSSS